MRTKPGDWKRGGLALLCALLAGGCASGEDDDVAAPQQRVRAPDAGAQPDAAGELVALGAVDPTFGTGGVVALSRPGVEPRDMLVQPDGKILIVGSLFVESASRFEGYAFRFLPDGRPDPGFGRDGVQLVTGDGLGATSLALDRDGKIVLGGSCDCELPARVWRLDRDGTPDPSFAAGGELGLDAEAAFIDHVVVEPDGAVRALGQALADGLYLARVRANGTVERAGVVVVRDFILHASVAQADGSWLLGGAVDPWPDRRLPGRGRTIDLARIGPDGAWDRTFGQDGLVALGAEVVGTATLAGGRLLLGLGQADLSRVEARRPDGQLDASFGQAGAADLGKVNEVFRIVAARDGSLEVVSGDSARLTIRHLRPDGAPTGAPWLSTLPGSVWIDHLQTAIDPASGDLLAAAIQHRRVAGGSWVVAGTALVRIPRDQLD